MLLADATKLLVVGISDYQDPELRLRFASFNARELKSVLTLEEGCSIPEENITLICDAAASKAEVVRLLQSVASSCRSDDIFIFYFSGHGERLNNAFYLLPFDSKTTDITHTAISTEDVQAALSECNARGVLLILDCCKSAGFAENSQKFFRTLGHHDFRLLLSASREGQLSYEYEASRGTLFSRSLVQILKGEIVSRNPGAIYFFDLFEGIQSQIAEDLELLRLPSVSQQPVFAGTYAKDPLLFLLKRLSFEKLDLQVPRYSRRFLRRKLFRLAGAIVVLITFALASYYYYLDHSRYVWHEPGVVADHEGDYLSIYAGDPRFNWLGFPHRIFTTDIRADALSDSRPGVGRPIQTHFTTDIEIQLAKSLSRNWKIPVQVWRSVNERVWEDAKGINVYDNPDESGQKGAIEGLASIADPSKLSALDDLISAEATSSSPAALRALALLDSEHAIRVLEEEELDDLKFSQAILQGLNGDCNAAVNRFVSDVAPHSFDNTSAHDAWFGAILRTNCTISSMRMLEVIQKASLFLERGLDWLPVLMSRKPSDFETQMNASLARSIHDSSEDDKSPESYRLSLLLWMKLRLAALISPATVPDSTSRLLASPFKHVRLAAARALLAKDINLGLFLSQSYGTDPWILSALVESGWYSEPTIRHTFVLLEAQSKPASGSYFNASLMFLLRTLRLHHVTQAEPLLWDVLPKLHSNEVKVETLRTIQSLIPPEMLSKEFEVSINALNIKDFESTKAIRGWCLHGTYEWFVRTKAGLLESALSSSIGEPEDAGRLFGRSKLRAGALDMLRRKFHDQRDQLSVATVLAMRGTKEDLYLLLSSPDCSVRTQAMLYAAYNPEVEKVLKDYEFAQFGSQVHWYLTRQMTLRTALSRQISATPLSVRGLAMGIIREQWPDISPGLWMWIDDQVDALEGHTVDGAQEINLDNSPPP